MKNVVYLSKMVNSYHEYDFENEYYIFTYLQDLIMQN